MNEEELRVKLGRLEERVDFTTKEIAEIKADVREVRDKVACMGDIQHDVKTLVKDRHALKGGLRVVAGIASIVGGAVGFLAASAADLIK